MIILIIMDLKWLLFTAEEEWERPDAVFFPCRRGGHPGAARRDCG